jgi:hypothetical protein
MANALSQILLAGGPPPAFPLSMGPTLWLDMTDGSTLYDSNVGGSLVALNGTIGRAEDKSGYGNNATQATAGFRPQWVNSLTTPTAKNIPLFDGTDDFFTLPNFLSGTAISVLYVSRAARLSVVQGPVAGNFGSEFSASSASHEPYSDGNIYSGFGSTLRKTIPAPGGITSWHRSVIRSDSGAWNYWKGGVQVFTTGTNTVGLGTTPKLGLSISSAGNYYYQGRIAEIVVVPRYITTTEIAAWDTYTLAKYGAI